MGAREDGLFHGSTTIRNPLEHRTALLLLIMVPVTLSVIVLAFHGISPPHVASLLEGGRVFVSLAPGPDARLGHPRASQ